MAPLSQFILFGDSITQGAFDQKLGFGLAAELANAYVRRFDVINRGYSAYNTKNALRVIDHVIPTPEQAKVEFLTIWFGANDCNKELTHNQYVPLEAFKDNLKSIIKHPLVTAHSPKIILITTPPFEETEIYKTQTEGNWGGDHRKQIESLAYADAVKEVGRELGIPVVDVWGKFMEAAGWKEGDELVGTRKGRNEVLAELLYDGLHLGPAGYKIVYDELVKVILENWPEFPPYNMAYVAKLPWEMEKGDEHWDVNE